MSSPQLETIVYVIGIAGLLYFLRKGRHERLQRGWVIGCATAFSALMAFRAYDLLRGLQQSLAAPRTWDFPGFYLYGGVAMAGKNVHSPAAYAEVLPLMNIPIELKKSFFDELVNVGCTYPTPSTLLFAPFALFEFPTAHAIWVGLLVISTATAIVFLWRWFADGWRSPVMLPIIGALVLFQYQTGQVYRFEQTDFIVITLLAAFLSCRSARAGYIAGFAIFVKPIMAITILMLLLAHRWGAVSRAIAVVIGAFLLAAMVLGPESVMSYFLDNPGERIHIVQYKQAHAQSLLNVILRLTDERSRSMLSPTNPVYLWVAIAMLLPSVMVAWLLYRQQSQHLANAVLIALAVAIYPGTLAHYGVFLIVPVLGLLLASAQPRVQVLAGLFGVAMLLILQQPNQTFMAAMIMWETAMLCGIWVLVPKPAMCAGGSGAAGNQCYRGYQ